MGIGYDDDTLRAEHEEREKVLRDKKADGVGVVGFLVGAWLFILSLVWIGLEHLPPSTGGAVFALGVASAVTVWVITFYLAVYAE